MTEIKVFSGTSNLDFAQNVCKYLGISLGKQKIDRFKDGEVQIEFGESVRGHHCFVIQSTCPPANDHYMELFLMLDALRRASAKAITVVMPYYGYGRQDRKVAPRAPISAKAVAQLCETSGASRLLCLDLHSTQIQGFFNIPMDHLFAVPSLAEEFTKRCDEGQEFVVISPDSGGVERARAFAKKIKSQLGIIDKRREAPNQAEAYHIIGDVKDKNIVIVDDMVDTAGTLVQAAKALKKYGAQKIYMVATHAVLSGPAIERINQSPIKKILVTDSIPLKIPCEKIVVTSIAPLVAKAIKCIYTDDSISSLFN